MAGVEIKGLVKTYPVGGRSFAALRDVSLYIAPGSFNVIVGRSGCGKTTLLRIIAGLETASSGEIRLMGKSLSQAPVRVGIMFQEHRLMPWLTVRENMAFSLGGKDEQAAVDMLVEHYLKVLGLEHFQSAFPSQLSGGMAQRAALGRSLCYNPDIILMDEPFGALDYFTRKKLQKELVELFLNQKKTVIFVTHDVSEAAYLGQNIIVMQEGRVKKNLQLELPFPRDPVSKELIELQGEILRLLEDDHIQA